MILEGKRGSDCCWSYFDGYGMPVLGVDGGGVSWAPKMWMALTLYAGRLGLVVVETTIMRCPILKESGIQIK